MDPHQVSDEAASELESTRASCTTIGSRLVVNCLMVDDVGSSTTRFLTDVTRV